MLAVNVTPASARAHDGASVRSGPTAERTNRVLDVTCAATVTCVAVGSYSSGGGTEALLDVERSGTWGVVTAPQPADAVRAGGDAVLDAVACPSAAGCVVTGQTAVPGGAAALLDVESAGSWHNVTVPLPADASATAPDASLSAVTCAAAGTCVAVGSYASTKGEQQALLVVESSGVWADVVVPLPADASTTAASNALAAVACSGATSCAATGSYVTGGGAQQALLVTSTSSTWSDVVVPLPAGASTTAASNALDTVSCAAAGGCVAGGSYVDASTNHQALLVTSMSGSWTSATAPLPADASAAPTLNSLSSVACASTTSCVAVGVYQDATGYQKPLLESWSAGTWSAIGAPLPPDAETVEPFDTFDAVSCPAVDECVAVGFYTRTSQRYLYPQALLDVDAGGTWRSVGVTVPSDGSTRHPSSLLTSVSCTSIVECAATGVYADRYGGTQLLIEQLSKTLDPVPVVPGPPRGVVAHPGHGQATVTWSPPAVDGGSPVVRYTATASPGGQSCSTSATRCTIRALVTAPTVTITVTASSVIGDSAPSVPTRPVAIAPPPTGGVTIVPFAPRSAAITPALAAQVRHLAAMVAAGGNTHVHLIGFSDDSEPPRASLAISAARARAVRAAFLAALAHLGVRDVAVSVGALGQADAVGTDATSAGRAMNRRVLAQLRR